MSDQPKRAGRPRKIVSERKNASLKFRTRGSLRTRIDAAAVAAGLSASQYVEQALEQHFYASDLRQIVREEIAAALSAPMVHTVTGVSAARVRPSVVARIPRNDHLPS